MSRICTLIFILVLVPASGNADEQYSLDIEALKQEVYLPNAWLYRAGDDLKWADPDFDDSAWETTSIVFTPQTAPPGWDGVGWFRLHFDVPPEFLGRSLALRFWRSGDLDLFLDGKQIAYSEQDDYWSIITITELGKHVLAARYQLDLPGIPLAADWHIGFSINVSLANNAVAEAFELFRGNTFIQVLFAAIPLAFALLHIVLFFFLPQTKSNIWYAFLLVLWAAGVFFDHQSAFANGTAELVSILRIHRTIMVAVAIVSLRFVYSAFLERLPRRFWAFSAVLVAAGIPAILWPMDQAFQIFIIIQIAIIAEQFRVIIRAVRSGVDAAWLFLTGLIFVAVFGAYDAVLDLGLIQPLNGITNAYYIGQLGMFVCMTMYLAKGFARNWQQLREEEVRRLVVEADNTRRVKEMDEARDLQLSMLPRSFPKVPGYEIAVRMRTATEVGGDFYDGVMRKDGWFSFGIGDATGHGLRAGFMTFLFKILFDFHEMEKDLPAFMRRGNESMKKLKLRGVRAAMMTAMLKGPRLLVCSAGIPPFYIHRATSGKVEEVLIPGLMLGSSLDFPFEQREMTVEPGDTLLFMTDGLPEMLNEDDEEFGYDRVKQLFGKVANRPVEDLIDDLSSMVDSWSGDTPLEDDITFLVLRYRLESGND